MFRLIPRLLAAGALVALSAAAGAQDALVIEGARIVCGDGQVIERGVVVILGDKIAQVGPLAEGQAAPAGQRIDGKGLTVYPGLIDSFCLAGVAPPPAAPAQPATQQPAGGQRRGPGQAGGFTPPPAAPMVWRKATEGFNGKSAALDGLRSAGFTTALFGVRGVLTPGEDVLMALTPGDMPSVIKELAAVNLNTQSRGFNTYPSTLMGAVAFLRQAFYDAIFYASQPHDKTDRRLTSLGDAAAGKAAVYYAAQTENDIRRALRFGKEFNVRVLILGGRDAEKAISDLKGANAAVVLTADWAPAVALQKAGIPFALASNSLEMTTSEATGLRERAQDLVAKGVPADAVLAALTRVPAGLLGAGDRLGVVAAGRTASLVVSEGDLFAKEGKVKFVVVNGKRVDPVQVKANAGPKPQRFAEDGVPFRTVTEDDADGDGGAR